MTILRTQRGGKHSRITIAPPIAQSLIAQLGQYSLNIWNHEQDRHPLQQQQTIRERQPNTETPILTEPQKLDMTKTFRIQMKRPHDIEERLRIVQRLLSRMTSLVLPIELFD